MIWPWQRKKCVVCHRHYTNKIVDNLPICIHCWNREVIKCTKCKKEILVINALGGLCLDCHVKLLIPCEMCSTKMLRQDLEWHGNSLMCQSCSESYHGGSAVENK